ncbi:hypothetical protein [Natronomonas marina]|uniref:hypothetical protein n=1 Tax=Natronomonas marina TaxID=2961939 RepID=UPI0020C9DCA5|nr:hypothetical protein [Natronomonas marina]
MPAADPTAEWRELALLWAARRCGALEALATTAGTPEGVAEAADIDPAAAERLVAALHARGFLARVGDEYEPADRMLGFLTKADLRSVGGLPAEVDAFQRWVDLPATLAGEDVPEPPDAVRNELGRAAVLDETRVRSEVTTAVHAAPDGETVVLVGDGAGRRGREFADRGWSVTLLEAPGRIDAVEPLLRSTPVDLRGGDATDLPDCDLVVGVGTLRRHEPAGAREVVEAASDAAGAAVFLDAFYGETPDAELFDVGALSAGEGRVHDVGAVRSWLDAAFGTAGVESVPASPLSAAVGRAID